jgi:hypothetical protein
MDGIAIIVVTVPGTLPYEILLNGNSWGVALDNVFQVSGLEVGAYTIQIVDASGCVSNILDVSIPFPGIAFNLGMSWFQTDVNEINDEPVSQALATQWRSTVTSSLAYYVGKTKQELLAKFVVPVADHPGFTELAYISDIRRYTLKGGSVALQGGLGSHFEKHESISTESTALPKYLLLKAGSEYTIAKRFRLHGSIEMRCWDRIEKPRIELGLSIPFGRRALRWVN